MSLHHRLVPAAFALLAVVASGIAVYYGYQSQSGAARVAQLERDAATARADAAQARESAQKFQAKAAELDAQLGNVKTRATAVETKSVQLHRELASTKSSLTERQQREVALLAEIEALRQKIQAAGTPATATTIVPPSTATVVAAPPTSAASISSEELSGYRQRIASLEVQLTELLTRALAEPVAGPDEPAETTPTAVAVFKVVRIGAQDAFVIVDFGADHGAQRGDTLFVSRGTSVVAAAEISDARPRFSVAHVLPAKSKGQLQTGDIVLLAR